MPDTPTLYRRLRTVPKVELVSLVMELARRTYQGDPATTIAVNNSGQAVGLLRVHRVHLAKVEELWAVALDAQNHVASVDMLSRGSLNTTRTLPREVFAPAILAGAAGIILAHNHPSGSLNPSPEDIAMTRSMGEAGATLGIEVYDHIIVTREGYTSLRETGKLG